MLKLTVIPLLVAASLSSAAAADPVDNYAARYIAAAKYDLAAAQLQQVVREDAYDHSALLNLALVYRQTGRSAEATRLYRRILANDDAMVGMMDGHSRSAHDLARQGLSKTVTLAAR